MNEEIKDWTPKDLASAQHLNAALPTVRSVQFIQGGSGISVTQTETGTTISADPPFVFTDHFLGIVTDVGPDDEPDLSGAGMYWVQVSRILGQDYPFFLTQIQANGSCPPVGDAPNSFQDTVPVANVAEIVCGETNKGTRILPTDGSRGVHVFVFTATDGSTRYVMDEAVHSVTVRLGVNLTDNSGTYIGTAPDTSFIQSGSVTNDRLAGFTDGTPCIVVNTIEVNYTQPYPTANSPTHLLPLTIDGEDQYYLGQIVGTDTSSGNPWSGWPIVEITVPVQLDVTLTAHSGGSNGIVVGSTITCPTYKYDGVHVATGNKVFDNVAPTWNRPCAVLTGPATKGHIGFDAGGDLVFEDCDEVPDFTKLPCCDPCPSDCTSCPNTYTFTIGGMAGNYAYANGDYTITKTVTTTGCIWQYNGPVNGYPSGSMGVLNIDVRCVGGIWQQSVAATCLGGVCSQTWIGNLPVAGTCPPLMTIALPMTTGAYTGCPAQNMVVAMS